MLLPNQCAQARTSRDPRFDGLFFVLVKSTKIFCRNTCKVRLPLEKNVSYASSAQLALAQGYRPCLRCRPDSAPNSSAWMGTHTSLLRAMALLIERRNSSIEDIATSLGISSRYLHKLFIEHLSVSPKRYRLYQQVLIAKTLLQQTRLSVEQVATSVGFNSARQLQQHVKAELKLTPTQIRNNPMPGNTQQNGEGTQLSSDITLLLSYRPPYDWPLVQGFLSRRAINGNEVFTPSGFTKVLRLANKHTEQTKQTPQVTETLSVPVNIVHCPKEHGFTVSFNAAYSEYTIEITRIISRMLDLHADPLVINHALEQAGLNQNQLIPGLRLPGVASVFEAGCRAILGQQVSVTAAVNKVNELYQHFASEHDRAFPSAKTVASSDLLFLKMPARRRQSLIDFAAYCAQEEQETFDSEAMLNIKGIGPWHY